ncbi:hypothetical protein DVH24_030687 [Malus domestica]|uniref:Uncharacterized protein n=1 Tax=Malus domestica TaxID=3750 RepID=A0A498HDK2_MALDO|nr:hypothetical protein DVH24_030687 [Malus domestica]
MNPLAHLGLSLPSRSSHSVSIPKLIFRTKRVCFTTRIFVLQSKTFPFKNCIGSAFNVKGIMECPNCREIENGEWRYYVSRSPDHELYLSEDEMDYENSPIEFLDMVKVMTAFINITFFSFFFQIKQALHNVVKFEGYRELRYAVSIMVQSLPRMIIMDENGKQFQMQERTRKARVREMGASSSRSTTGEVNALKEEVTTLKGQLAAQGKHMRA